MQRMLFGAQALTGDAPADQAGQGGSNPTAPLFRKEEWIVDLVPFAFARRFIEENHYAGGCSNTATLTTGLYRRGRICKKVLPAVGVTLWIPPIKATADFILPDNWKGVLACSRMVILDEIPHNAESFLLRHSMRFIDRSRWPALVSYSDDWKKHKGTIYKAAGWTEIGKTAPRPIYVRDGRVVSTKANVNTRTDAEMIANGCERIGSFAKTRWVHRIDAN